MGKNLIRGEIEISDHIAKCRKIGEEIGEALKTPEDLLREIHGKIATATSIGIHADFQPAMILQTLKALQLNEQTLNQIISDVMNDPETTQNDKDIYDKMVKENNVVVRKRA